MANNLDKNIENMNEQTSAAMEAIELLKQKQQSEKSRKTASFIITLTIIASIVVVIILVSKAKTKNDDIQRVLNFPDSIATVNCDGDRCYITNNLKTSNLYVKTVGLGTFLSPGQTDWFFLENSSGTRQCYEVAASDLEDNPHQICNH